MLCKVPVYFFYNINKYHQYTSGTGSEPYTGLGLKYT